MQFADVACALKTQTAIKSWIAILSGVKSEITVPSSYNKTKPPVPVFRRRRLFCAGEPKSYSKGKTPLPHLGICISFAAMDVSNAFQLHGVLPQNKETLLPTFDRLQNFSHNEKTAWTLDSPAFMRFLTLVRVVIQNFSKTIVVQFVFKVIG